MRIAQRRGTLLPALLLCSACGGDRSGGGSGTAQAPFGLTVRTPVAGLAFPTGLAQPTPLSPVLAFPNLGFNRPVILTFPPDGTDRIFVVEVDGLVHTFPNNPAVTSASVTTFLDLTPANGGELTSGGETGLLGFAFHPDYASNGWFYVCYTVPSPLRTRLSRFTVSIGNPDRANPNSERILLEIAQPFSNHNGGCLAFGADDRLYLSSGDGGSADDPFQNAQNLGNLLGKILRLEDDGSVPLDNPFTGVPGARGEIWCYGLRNPWRFSFDRNTGDLWCGDVGQNAWEEVDLIERGGNYGWDFYEGNTYHEGNPNAANLISPVIEYSHSLGRSVTGGVVYRGPTLPSMQGAYLYADFITGRVWALVLDRGQVLDNQEVAQVANPAGFGEDQAGEAYVCSFDGNIYRFDQVTPTPAPSVPALLSSTGLFADTGNLVAASGLIEYEVNARLWSDGARKRRWIALPGTTRIEFAVSGAWVFPIGTVLVKHFEVDTPSGVRRLETRVFVNTVSGWQGYTYRWNGSQTDADLLSGSLTETITIVEGDSTVDVGWTYPSRLDCTSCHTAASGQVLGIRTLQLNRDHAYPQVIDNQLRAWNHIDLFTTDLGAATQYAAMPDPQDVSAPLGDRARAYLAANCAPCHQPGGPTPVDMDLRYSTPDNLRIVLGIPSTNPAGGPPPTFRIQAFSRTESEVWIRMGLLGVLRMPPLGSHRVDTTGRELLGQWIDAGAD